MFTNNIDNIFFVKLYIILYKRGWKFMLALKPINHKIDVISIRLIDGNSSHKDILIIIRYLT